MLNPMTEPQLGCVMNPSRNGIIMSRVHHPLKKMLKLRTPEILNIHNTPKAMSASPMMVLLSGFMILKLKRSDEFIYGAAFWHGTADP